MPFDFSKKPSMVQYNDDENNFSKYFDSRKFGK